MNGQQIGIVEREQQGLFVNVQQVLIGRSRRSTRILSTLDEVAFRDHLNPVKKSIPTVEPVSLGTRLAEKTRAAANTLSDEERERLLLKGMQLIYAGRRQKKPARRR